MGRLSGLGRMAMEALIPKTAAGKTAWGELALDFLPDAAFAVAAGANAPAGWKGALVGEDLALGLGASLLGRIGGEVVGRKLMGLDPVQHAGQLSGLRMAGSMGLSMGPALFGFRPITQKMIESENAKLEDQRLAQAEEEARHMKEAAIAAALSGAGMAARGPWESLGGLQAAV